MAGTLKSKEKTEGLSDQELLAKVLSIPSGYATVKLGMNLHPKQKAVLDSLFDGNMTRVIARCGNGTGKTSTIITAAIFYALDILHAQVISTSATYRQGVSQLIPTLKSYSGLFPSWRFLDSSITIDGVDKYLFFSTDDEGRFQGFHSKPNQPLLVIADESAAIGENIFRAIDRCQPTFLLMAGSPLGPEGYFYDAETKPNIYKHFKHFQIKQLDCKKSDGWWIEDRLIEEMVEKWGQDHPLVLSSVYAEFAMSVENQILSLAELNRCYNNPPEHVLGLKRVFIDFAAGGDENVIALRVGNQCWLRKCWREKDTMSCAGQIVDELKKIREEISIKDSEIWGDADGLGLPIIHRIRELGWKINEFHGGQPPFDVLNYKNRIAECWLETCKQIRECQIILPNDNELRGQFLTRRQRLNSSGKMELESKKDMTEASPDRADAVCCVMSNLGAGVVREAKAIRVGGHDYSQFQYF